MSERFIKYAYTDSAGLHTVLRFFLPVITDDNVINRLRLVGRTAYSVYAHIDHIDVELFIEGLVSIYCNSCLSFSQYTYNNTSQILEGVYLHLKESKRG